MSHVKTRHTAMRLPIDILEEVERLSIEHNLSRAAVVAWLLRKALDKPVANPLDQAPAVRI